MINYSKAKVTTKSQTGKDTFKVYARAQYDSVMSLSEFAKHISDHNSLFDRSTIEGVLLKMVQCMREELLLGRKIQLGDLGNFYVSLRSVGTDTAAEFSAANITDVKVKWTPGAEFQTLMSDAEFQFVASRAEQANAKSATNDAIDSSIGSGGTSSGGSSSGSGSGGGVEAN